MKIIQCFLGLFMIGTFQFFVLGEIFLTPENVSEESTFAVLQADWVQVYQDGSTEAVTFPGNCKAEYGEWVTVVTTLPDDQADTCFCIRSMQQDMKIYVGGQLRKEYSTLDTQPFGTTSTMTYVFFQIFSQDAGKELRIETMSDSFCSGYISEIYTAEMSHITGHIYKLYASSAIVAVGNWRTPAI